MIAACGGLLVTGCATMPDNGDVQPVKGANQGDSQVRVYAVAPRETADPDEIVDGFLEAMTSDDPGFATARKYLTKHAAQTWKPEQSITVLTTAPDRDQADRNADPDNQGRAYPLSGRKIATVDDRHAYQPISPAKYLQSIHVVQQPTANGKGREWRIDSLPPGLVLGEADFLRNYRSVNKYYFASGEDWVVADPVYIRQRQDPVTRMDPVTQTVRALLEGPTDWLKPAVDSSFPSGTELKKGVTTLTTDDQSTLKVPLNAKADLVGGEPCRRMAAQLLFTLGDLTSVRVEQVELQGSKGPLCRLGKGQAAEFAAVRNTDRDENPYFVDEHHKLMMLDVGGKEANAPTEVPGPLGKGTTRLQSVAVDRGETRAAGVGEGGRELYVSSITTEQEAASAILRSKAAKPTERLSAPSWDGRGDLWIADRDPAAPQLWMVPDGTGDPVKVRTPWPADDVRIESLRVSADGVRIALVVTRGGDTTLQIGRIQRQTSGDEPVVSVDDLQPAAPRMESVTAVSWAGPSRLVVVGKEAGGVQQIRYLQTDGSTSASSVLPGLNGVTSVAAPHDDSVPVVADSGNDGIVRLAPGTNWQPVVKTGTSPVYPG
ncbi:LpqB family beta-propeller domain-containing protein [Streptomyces sp. NBC_00572]|uniref:LpqB family beta-propeller domain-containing protein n=1 Tax=Streptomyces sp. NBC_00572 TaxID=2903664 RepID=UPI00224EC9DE|nr:LpqB family beta-propeller domain-containing protein [Streptomyces sp. NBC_00572]MCX4981229.1 LpqB family beta-propeller domain-containing protein [Streptomyces sp. NBC_00572]